MRGCIVPVMDNKVFTYCNLKDIAMENEMNASLVHFIFFSMQNENETRNRGKYKVYVYEHTRMTNHRTRS
uniref:Uncharacterized protein n=1 Tax=Candidatus Methanophaga sp. ANME-1 ERB7 TaxID=2759913 RepID=A0A7G9Z9K9_9EURY|nr:hypothetical protein KMABBJJO_00022 [Methanosarcinales archaeon ANME-1 ERB7]